MKAVFFSDAHLTKEDHERIDLVSRFISEVSRDADVVVVVGDLFEFYHGYDGFIYPWFRPIADALKTAASGRIVYFIEGNHEFKLGDYFEKYTGVRCRDEVVLDFDGKRVFVSHGDTVGGGSLKPILKSSFIYLLMKLFRPRLTWAIAMGCRHFLSRRTKGYNERVREKYKGYGRNKLQEGYDAVVLAHSHMADILLFTEGGKERVYLNTGDLIKSLSYGEYSSHDGFRLMNWDPQPGLDEESPRKV
jgi:UDP-2,3-diacylglucosamine hydrolase